MTFAPIEGPQAWYGRDLAGREAEWLHVWSAEETAEIEAAVHDADRRGLEILEIDKADFPLEKAAERLAAMKEAVLRGRGFYLLRGLNIEGMALRQAAIAFWGIGAHLGRPCSQNGKGHVLGHVKNLGLDYNDPMTRGYQTSARLPYHTDSSDIVGLLCWRPSKAGGLSSIVSSTTVYNEALKRRPDLMETLTSPFYRTRWGEVPEGKAPWAALPVFMHHEGKVVSHYVRSAIRKGQLMAETPRLTDAQTEALDLIDAIAGEDGVHLDMDFRPGDMQFVCNHFTWHSRTAFEDFEEPERRRHLLRLWLACADGPALPHWMTDAYEGKTADGRPNGIQVPGVPLIAPLEAA